MCAGFPIVNFFLFPFSFFGYFLFSFFFFFSLVSLNRTLLLLTTALDTQRGVLLSERNRFSGTILKSREPSHKNALILTNPESPSDQFQTSFASHNRGWTSASLCETLSARRSLTVLTNLAPPACASKKLEARENFVVSKHRRKFLNS